MLLVTEGASLRKMLMDEGADPNAAAAIQSALVANFSFDFRAGQKVRVGLAPDPETGSIRPVRVSLYERDDRHVATVALSDTGLYVAAQEPAVDEAVLAVAEQEQAEPAGALPTLHDGLWGTGLTLGMTPDVIKNLVHIFSYDVDYQTRLSASDSLEVIYAAEGGPEASEILYAALTLGNVTHRFYRFRDPDRRHRSTIMTRRGRARRNSWCASRWRRGASPPASACAATRSCAATACIPASTRRRRPGTPIMAAGDGVVEKIGTRAGYGRSITLKHLHGYETTYNHMSGYAKGLKAGDKVAQGPGHRLRRLDRPLDRPASALRGAGQRPLRRSAEDPRAARARAAGRGARRLRAGAPAHRRASGARRRALHGRGELASLLDAFENACVVRDRGAAHVENPAKRRVLDLNRRRHFAAKLHRRQRMHGNAGCADRMALRLQTARGVDRQSATNLGPPFVDGARPLALPASAPSPRIRSAPQW